MKEQHRLRWMCEVHALNIVCVCVCVEQALTHTHGHARDELAQVSPHRIFGISAKLRLLLTDSALPDCRPISAHIEGSRIYSLSFHECASIKVSIRGRIKHVRQSLKASSGRDAF